MCPRRERSRAGAAAFLGEDIMKELRQEYLPPADANFFRTLAMGQLVDWGWTLEDAVAVAGGRLVRDYELGRVGWSGIVWAAPRPVPIEQIDPHEYDDVIFDGDALHPHLLASSLAEAFEWPAAYVTYQVVAQREGIVRCEAFCLAPHRSEIPPDLVAEACAWARRKCSPRPPVRGRAADHLPRPGAAAGRRATRPGGTRG